jgi:hypothetical protein
LNSYLLDKLDYFQGLFGGPDISVQLSQQFAESGFEVAEFGAEAQALNIQFPGKLVERLFQSYVVSRS